MASAETGKSAREDAHEEDKAEDVYMCECGNCPDLREEEFSRCCKRVPKAQDHCIKLNIPCICQSPKLEKYFDKVFFDVVQCCLKSLPYRD